MTLDGLEQHLLPMLDGKKDQSSLVESLTSLVANGTLLVKKEGSQVLGLDEVRQIMASELEKKLRHFARQALLVG